MPPTGYLFSKVSNRFLFFFKCSYSLPSHSTLSVAKEQAASQGRSSFAFWSPHIPVPSPGHIVIAWKKEILCQLPTAVQGNGDAGNLSLAVFIHLDLQLNRSIFYQMFSISVTTTAFCPTFDSISGWLAYQITQYRCYGRGISHPGLFQNACYPATKRRAVFLSLATATQAGTPSLRNAWVHESLQGNHRSITCEEELRPSARLLEICTVYRQRPGGQQRGEMPNSVRNQSCSAVQPPLHEFSLYFLSSLQKYLPFWGRWGKVGATAVWSLPCQGWILGCNPCRQKIKM